jgi:uncharacterized lipoprotein YajG
MALKHKRMKSKIFYVFLSIFILAACEADTQESHPSLKEPVYDEYSINKFPAIKEEKSVERLVNIIESSDRFTEGM